MPDAQYWNGYDRILQRANNRYWSIDPSYGTDPTNFAALYEVLGSVLELLNRTSDYRDAAEAAQAANVFLSGLSGVGKRDDDASDEGGAKPGSPYKPTDKDLKKGYV